MGGGYGEQVRPTPEQYQDMKQFFEKQHDISFNRLFEPQSKLPEQSVQHQILEELKGIRYELTMSRWRDQSDDFQRFWDGMSKKGVI